MNKLSIVLLLGGFPWGDGGDPFKAGDGSVPFIVYYASRYRGMCVGSLVAPTVVLSAAVCVVNPLSTEQDTRPVTVIVGSAYRHPRRGLRVTVTQILIPKMTNVTGNRGYLLEKSAAVLLLKRPVPDGMVEVPLRALPVNWKGEEDPIFPVHRFLLQRTLRVQFLNIVRKSLWCEVLSINFQKALTNMGFFGFYDTAGSICVKDVDRCAQPCHGMYGAPLVCRGQLTAMLTAPDAQWTNCTGGSNLYHVLYARNLRKFMDCVSRLFEPTLAMDWTAMKRKLLHGDAPANYDYVPALYDKLDRSTSDETDTEEDLPVH